MWSWSSYVKPSVNCFHPNSRGTSFVLMQESFKNTEEEVEASRFRSTTQHRAPHRYRQTRGTAFRTRNERFLPLQTSNAFPIRPTDKRMDRRGPMRSDLISYGGAVLVARLLVVLVVVSSSSQQHYHQAARTRPSGAGSGVYWNRPFKRCWSLQVHLGPPSAPPRTAH